MGVESTAFEVAAVAPNQNSWDVHHQAQALAPDAPAGFNKAHQGGDEIMPGVRVQFARDLLPGKDGGGHGHRAYKPNGVDSLFANHNPDPTTWKYDTDGHLLKAGN